MWWFAQSHLARKWQSLFWMVCLLHDREAAPSLGVEIYPEPSIHPEPRATSAPLLTRSHQFQSEPRWGEASWNPEGGGTVGGYSGWPPAGWLKFKLWSSQQSWGSSQDCTGKRKDESLNYFSCNSIPGITLHGKSTLESLSYLNDRKIRAKLMIPSNTYEWSSFGFNYLIFWTGNTFTGSDTRK